MSFTHPTYYFWQNKISSKDLKSISNFIKKNKDSDEDKNVSANGKNTVSLNMNVGNLCKQFPILDEMISDCFYVNKKEFGFNLYENISNETAVFNEYDIKINGKYDWHIDNSMSPNWDMKLTILINLSDKKFTGGLFQLNIGEIIDIPQFAEPASMIMFRSNTLHRVLPLESGNRKTLAIFLGGPRLI